MIHEEQFCMCTSDKKEDVRQNHRHLNKNIPVEMKKTFDFGHLAYRGQIWVIRGSIAYFVLVWRPWRWAKCSLHHWAPLIRFARLSFSFRHDLQSFAVSNRWVEPFEPLVPFENSHDFHAWRGKHFADEVKMVRLEKIGFLHLGCRRHSRWHSAGVFGRGCDSQYRGKRWASL